TAKPEKIPHEDTRHHRGIEPALSPTIMRKLSRVIPANLQIDARWETIRKAREAAKKKNGKNAPSPSVMIAWAVVRAMEKHAPFRRLILEDEGIVENETFEVITLSLTFDHRVVNGAGAANFVHEIKQQIESFKIPAGGTRAVASH